MCALFVWSASPGARISVPGRRAVARNGRVMPGRPRYDVVFGQDGALETSDVDEVLAVRLAMPFAHGAIQEISGTTAPVGVVEVSEATLAAAIERLIKAIRRDEELDQL